MGTGTVAVLLALDPRGWMVFAPAKWAVLTTWTCVTLVLALRRDEGAVDRPTRRLWITLLVVIAFAALAAPDPLSAWLGTPDRHAGAGLWLVLLACFVVGQHCAGRDDRRVVALAMTGGLGLVDVVCLLEWSGHPVVDLAGGSGRLTGPFGSAAYLGAACALLVPVAAGVLGDPSTATRGRRIAGAALAGSVVPVVGSQTRAAWIGLAVAGITLFWVRRSPGRRHAATRRRSVSIGLTVVAAVVLVTPFADRVGSSPDALAGRIDEWRIGVRSLMERPLLGHGPEGYRIAFPRAVDEDYVLDHGRAVITDRAHNGVLDVALAAGLPGAAVYVALLVVVLHRARTAMAQSPLACGLAAALVAYITQQQFLFPLAEVDPLFWVVAGIVVGGATTARSTRPSFPRRVRRGRVTVFVLGVAAFVCSVAGVADMWADRRARDALEAAASGDHAVAIAAAERASDLRPDSLRYALLDASMAAAAGTRAALLAGVSRLDEVLAVHPGDPAAEMLRAETLTRLASLTRQRGDIDAARQVWDERVVVDPLHPRNWLGLGDAAAIDGDGGAAREAWDRALVLAPHDPAPEISAARFHLEHGDSVSARLAIERALAIDADDAEARMLFAQLGALRD